MCDKSIKDLVDHYIHVSFSVNKIAEGMIKEEISSDLTNDQHYTLRYINKVGTCTSSELAEVFDVKKSAITAIITRLWEKGLILRTRDENDRRLVHLSLTEEGDELFRKTEERIQALVGSFIEKFDQDEIVQFLKTYDKLNEILTDRKSRVE
ncbi:MarR family winged helix-turn-helix transcriptional regulator [Mesobacillus selenatarsenatis]|uniref:Transcriptional regulator, MarR family n=1 Tax=Mesobacillus selenatarsenatis (strain DSM 18680 / JCM 14380 / FERM P-15431 / SF-1) TaxID=1321606 RepID=A0A0A8X816_MESS1|nr:MarR family transcriptional regulator [Mesobacillus selenatarsenatis]GAM14291.1 transcriptional regulator, MarR family [Mesobacillus selenatarsenatis SF-1]